MLAAIYARKSTDQAGIADDQKSVARQIDHARQYAAGKGWTVAEAHVYADDAVSGAETNKLVNRWRLLDAISAGSPFRVLIMRDASRFSRRDGDEAFGELKRIAKAGVEIWFYQDGTRFEYGNFAANITGIVRAEMNAEYRRQIAQWTTEAMERKARAGHVTGGRVFGYRNVERLDTSGQRSHVERVIEPTEADVIRQIFRLSAEGHGVKTIAHQLNAAGAVSPRAQRGRSKTWAPSSVREVLFRPLYRGELVWNRTRKRDVCGEHHQTDRPEADWIRRPAPELRIVSEADWTAAHARIDTARAVYLKATGGQAFGRPSLGNPSKYLLTNLAFCGCCGGPLRVRTRKHGNGRKYFYGCAAYHERGRTVCGNNADVPMMEADDIVLEALLDDVITPDIVADAVDVALELLQGDASDGRLKQIDRALATIEQERARFVDAIASGGALPVLLEALRTREQRQGQLEAERATLCAQAPISAREAGRVRNELLTLARSWCQVLADDPTHARPIVSALLNGRVSFKPLHETGTVMERVTRWELRGEGTLAGLFSGEVFPSGWRPHRDSIPTGIAFVRRFRAA